MSLNHVEIDLLKQRKHAAESALSYFKKIKPIKSTNNPFARISGKDISNLKKYRKDANDGTTENSIFQSFDDASSHGIGNCDEKGRICYAALIGNPRIPTPKSYVSLVEAVQYDHVFVIVADRKVENITSLQAMPATTMIVDGWTEDWYFPRLSWTSASWYGFSNIPNPRQLYVRTQIDRHAFREYGGKGGTPAAFVPRAG